MGRIMAAHLSLTATLAQFGSFLLETIGIEENVYTVQEARASAKRGSSAWAECCALWREKCALAPDDQVFSGILDVERMSRVRFVAFFCCRPSGTPVPAGSSIKRSE